MNNEHIKLQAKPHTYRKSDTNKWSELKDIVQPLNDNNFGSLLFVLILQ